MRSRSSRSSRTRLALRRPVPAAPVPPRFRPPLRLWLWPEVFEPPFAPGRAVIGGALVRGVPAPGAVAPPAVLGVVAVGVEAAPGAVVAGAGLAGADAAVGAVDTIVVAGGLEPESPASLTRAAASTPSDSAIRTATAAIGGFQLGAAASRVRAAAPQRRHHSWSARNGAPHSGQLSP